MREGNRLEVRACADRADETELALTHGHENVRLSESEVNEKYQPNQDVSKPRN